MTETDTEFVERMTSRWHSKKNKPIGDIDMAHLLDLARRGAAVQWRPISEAPKDGTPILIFYADAAENCAVMWWDEYYDTFMGYYDGIDPGTQPTHFMPLPPPPSGEPRDE